MVVLPSSYIVHVLVLSDILNTFVRDCHIISICYGFQEEIRLRVLNISRILLKLHFKKDTRVLSVFTIISARYVLYTNCGQLFQ